MQQTTRQIVFTDKARCRDCYRCVRACPVKAIGVKDGQAFVVENRCLACGTCIRECPQDAKMFRNDLERAMRLLAGPDRVAASIAPSFAALCPEWKWKRLPSVLRRLGFAYVAETAVGAYHVAAETARVVESQPDRPHIASACPAVVSYVEKYRPRLTDTIVPVVSPMIAHARHLKQQLGAGTKVIFIGPCVAKKAEAERPEYAGVVDCVLTFREFGEWLDRVGLDPAECEESTFDEQPPGYARFFPLPGGLARTAAMRTDLLDVECVAPNGFEDVRSVLEATESGLMCKLVEPLFCAQGCINGAGILEQDNVYERRGRVLEYARHPGNEIDSDAGFDLRFSGLNKPPLTESDDLSREFTEQQILAVLEQTGKAQEEDRLNCGACGYSSCRDKAIAVLRGLAEPQMCIPQMRRMAERRTDRIIETSPNGIVILDERLNIISMNPAFRRFFCCTDATCGKRISYLMDPEPFERLAADGEEVVVLTVNHEKYNVVCHQIIYRLPEENQYVGIFVNITNSQANEEKLQQLRSETAEQARELLEHQITMAQQIARLLGESTAKGEQLVRHLLMYASDPPASKDKPWVWDMQVSK
ncbi:MAG TPA: [Fe-Fe] hydrogenase large subunit C-terminal domain-containing protein [Phycisphaerae bacterium]|nr:[Fe-Fe] hydrogenase large subunit C-terminal domain-containing protein [Phycisphaerae bacterium]HOJ73724.1 [Fe-Fe] hydrogenase large subunit C-terminal domain-containing protein [Phycisphaerae bacterium]HOM50371.1 [Fe-Fe] hydrogenase large subunit C-terminal domain-containing protein [Phycisphaerae bacterium]HON66303.1 [Fe-Fe] hydrogenase large subunit C-terminal domain-containing protein [Phycisphaerae bacterium]HOQ84217.1 [Fe-Fe] hydrogenase large subunit C-terminal domain-containing prote